MANRKFTIKASKSAEEMIGAFESRIEELQNDEVLTSEQIGSCDSINGSEDIEISPDDEWVVYEDEEGGFGEPGDQYTFADIKRMWNEWRHEDPVIAEYGSFEDWWRDTKQYLKEIEY